MIRLLALLLSLGATSATAIADMSLHPMPFCRDAQMSNPTTGTVSRLTPELLVRASEVIIDGFIESYRPPTWDGGRYRPGLAIVRVDKVWKGEVTARIAYLTSMPFLVGEWPARAAPLDCSNPVRTGVQVRIGAAISGNTNALSAIFPEIDGNMEMLGRGRLWSRELIYLPLHEPTIDALLIAYQSKTAAMRRAAETGDQQAHLAFADYLLDNNEDHRAFAIYDDLADKNQNDLDLLLTLAVARTKARMEAQPEATLAVVRARAPKTEKWRSKIARARLAATGVLTAEGKDWSDLKRMHTTCYSWHENFDGALFDRADLPKCAFRYSSFRNASFRGTDLSGSYFQDSDLSGAQYDCATNLPDDLDPVGAGMINVDGKCTDPLAPQ